MIRLRVIFLDAVLVFIIGFVVAHNVVRVKVPHTWLRSYHALENLVLCVECYNDIEGDYPDQEVVNSWIEYIWHCEGDRELICQSEEFESFSGLYNPSTYHHLKKWERPVYIVSDAIPDARGFYTLGDDGMTSSNGNDPDDINSWDFDSFLYYHNDYRNRQSTPLHVLFGLILSAVVVIILVVMRVCLHKPNKPQHPTASS